MSGVSSKEQTNGEGHDLTKNDAVAVNEQKPKLKPQISLVELDRIVADSLKDIEVYDDDGDDDDPALLNELSHIIEPDEVKEAVDVPITTTNSDAVVPKLLQQRIEMYKIAEGNAISANESSRARRFARGLLTLDTMLKDSLAGIAINMEDIPPEVKTGPKVNSPSVK